MTTQYTPGPWEVFNEEGVSVRPGIEATKFDFSVVLFGAADDDAGVRGRSREELEANARLIAAAPDLLEALQDVATYRGGADHATQDEYVMDRVRAAVNKATGLE